MSGMASRIALILKMKNVHRKLTPLVIVLLMLLVPGKMVMAADDTGYHDYTAMTKFLQQLAKDHSELITLENHGQTPGKRILWSATISAGDPTGKPALLVAGGVEGSDAIGSELCLRFITTLATQYSRVDSITQLLKHITFYVFPRVNPDASEAFFISPKYERTLNNRRMDLDKDDYSDEDGYDDVNGDGFITMMRIKDPSGEWLPDPEIPQLLRRADRAKGQKGIYRFYTEGVDNDGDGQWNEDEPGGVNFNRNFSYNYQFFTYGAGQYQMSEIESNTLAKFIFSHPNIACIFCFSPNDNLSHPWQVQKDEKADGSAQPEKPLTGVLANDAPYFNQIAEKFKQITGLSDAPEPPKGEGAFSEWAYFHGGRWSFSIPAWWPPVMKDTCENGKADTTEQQKNVKKPNPEKADQSDPIAGQRLLWKWLAATGQTDAFIPWKKVAHPDFPDSEVEVGGFMPYTGINPPADSIKTRSQKYNDFLLHLATLLPQITISKIKVEVLHENIFRLQVFVTNNGLFPTNTDLGVLSKWNPKVKLSLTLEKGQQLLDNKRIKLINTIAGSGGTFEQSWVIMAKKGSRIRINAESPMAGSDEKSVVLE
jgi:hypothetical protein